MRCPVPKILLSITTIFPDHFAFFNCARVLEVCTRLSALYCTIVLALYCTIVLAPYCTIVLARVSQCLDWATCNRHPVSCRHQVAGVMLPNVQVVAQLWLTSFFYQFRFACYICRLIEDSQDALFQNKFLYLCCIFLAKPGNSRSPARLQYQDLPANPRKNLFLPLQKQQNRKFTFHKNGIKYFTTFYKTTA